jgi:uncharacterized protein (TIGR03435 family)
MDTEHFDIVAKTDPSVSTDHQLMEMLKSLLSDRFQLSVHEGTKEILVYALEVGKNGPKLTEASSTSSRDNTATNDSEVHLRSNGISMDRLAEQLSRRLDRPVVNTTGLTGNYDIDLKWALESSRTSALDGPDSASIFTAIQEQLGLRLHAKKLSTKIIVVDHAEQPSQN